MNCWRIIVSFIFGSVALALSCIGGYLYRLWPGYFAVLFALALLLLLMCMSTAQDDGRVRKEPTK